MKNLIYPAFAAVLLLSACKGDSFMTQRYTKLGHSKNKKTVEDKGLAKNNIHVSKMSETPTKKNSESNDIVTGSITTNVIKNNTDYLFASNNLGIEHAIANPSESKDYLNNSVTKPELKKVENNERKVGSKKTLAQKTIKARGLIGSAFFTALYIVLVIVIVVVLLIIIF